MNALGSVLIDRADKVLINVLCHKRNHRSRSLGDSNKCGIKSEISIDLILLKTLFPVTLTAAANIPVTHIVDKFLKSLARLGNSVICHIVVNALYHRIKL